MRKLVTITWLDHCSFSASQWRHVDEVSGLRPSTIESVGYVISETDDYIIIGAGISDQDMVIGEMLVLKQTITSIRKL